jgi:hypothetical protein
MTAEEIIQVMSKRGLRITNQAVEIMLVLYGCCKDGRL